MIFGFDYKYLQQLLGCLTQVFEKVSCHWPRLRDKTYATKPSLVCGQFVVIGVWKGKEDNAKVAKVTWEFICNPKNEGDQV